MSLKTKKKKYEDWITQDGRTINIGDMTEDHLRNVLNMLVKNRNAKIASEFKQFVQSELKSLGLGRYHWKQ